MVRYIIIKKLGQLIETGFNFRGSDTEVLIAAYSKWGIEFLVDRRNVCFCIMGWH